MHNVPFGQFWQYQKYFEHFLPHSVHKHTEVCKSAVKLKKDNMKVHHTIFYIISYPVSTRGHQSQFGHMTEWGKQTICLSHTRSCLFCSELVSAMGSVVKACIVCSGIENKGWSRLQALWLPWPLGDYTPPNYCSLLSFTRSCDLLEQYKRSPLLESGCTQLFP